MTRFREEIYAGKSFKKATQDSKVQGAGHSRVAAEPLGSIRTEDQERRALRSEYFKAQAKGKHSPTAAQGRLAWQDQGFG